MRKLLTLIGVLFFASSFGQPVPELLYYRFDSLSPSVKVPNLASAPPAGTDTAVVMGGLTQGPGGQCGNALTGSGMASSTDYLNTGYTTNLAGSWTFSMWTSNITPSVTLFYIFGDVTAGSFRCFTNGLAGAGNWVLRGFGITDVYVNGGATIAPHVTTFVYDESAGNIKAYLDGVLVNTVVQGVISISGPGPFKVMGYGSNVGAPLGGLLDQFCMYNRAISDSEVMQLYTLNAPITISGTACDSYTVPGGDTAYTTSGTYIDTIPRALCGDSILTINVTITNSTSSSSSVTACDSMISPSGNYTWTSSGTYLDTITNMAGCDSVMTLDLIINNSTSSSSAVTACGSMIFPSGNYTWTSSGTYLDTIPNMAGCDSVMTLDLIIKNSTSSSSAVSACDSMISPSGNYTWTSSGTYMDTIPNMVGCDSVLTLNLIIKNSTSATFTVTACDSFVWQDHTYMSSGTYDDTISNGVGCDSVMTLNLIINNSTSASFTVAACESYAWQGNTYTLSGTYLNTVSNSAGCDSLMTLNLTIKNSSGSAFTTSACDTFGWQGNAYTSSGIYLDTISNSVGCDSVMTLDLLIYNSTSASFIITACDSYAWQGNTYTSSGTYMNTLLNSVGCDSVMTLNLTINTVDTSVSVSGSTLTSNATGAVYQWLDCNNGNSPIAGATNQSYTPAANGNYAVVITWNNCSDTSACINVIPVGIDITGNKNQMIIYPNPSKGSFTIQSTGEGIYFIRDELGQTIQSFELHAANQYTVKIENLSHGVYFIGGSGNDQITRKMVVVIE